MFEYRQVLARMRQGDSDRDIARAGLMGRKKLATVRQAALDHDWLNPAQPLPDDAVLAAMFGRNPQLPRTCVSTLEPLRELITQWFLADIQGTTIHSALQRNHGYSGSYSAVRRFLHASACRRARRSGHHSARLRAGRRRADRLWRRAATARRRRQATHARRDRVSSTRSFTT